MSVVYMFNINIVLFYLCSFYLPQSFLLYFSSFLFSTSLCQFFLSVITWHWFERLNLYKAVRLSQTLWLRRSMMKVGGHQMTLRRKLSQQSSADEFSSAQSGILISATTCITAVTKLLLSYSRCQTFTCTHKEHACHGGLNFHWFLEL